MNIFEPETRENAIANFESLVAELKSSREMVKEIQSAKEGVEYELSRLRDDYEELSLRLLAAQSIIQQSDQSAEGEKAESSLVTTSSVDDVKDNERTERLRTKDLELQAYRIRLQERQAKLCEMQEQHRLLDEKCEDWQVQLQRAELEETEGQERVQHLEGKYLEALDKASTLKADLVCLEKEWTNNLHKKRKREEELNFLTASIEALDEEVRVHQVRVTELQMYALKLQQEAETWEDLFFDSQNRIQRVQEIASAPSSKLEQLLQDARSLLDVPPTVVVSSHNEWRQTWSAPMTEAVNQLHDFRDRLASLTNQLHALPIRSAIDRHHLSSNIENKAAAVCPAYDEVRSRASMEQAALQESQSLPNVALRTSAPLLPSAYRYAVADRSTTVKKDVVQGKGNVCNPTKSGSPGLKKNTLMSTRNAGSTSSNSSSNSSSNKSCPAGRVRQVKPIQVSKTLVEQHSTDW